MALRLVSLPSPLPVTVADLKAHTRIDASDEDALIEVYLKAAIEQIERAAGVGFVGATYEWTADEFPEDEIDLGFGPVVSVTTLAYVDADGDDQTLAAELYTLDTSAGTLTVLDAWPDTDDIEDAVTVTFVAGTGECPEPIRVAIMLTAASSYEDRLEGGELTGPAQRLVGQYRRVWF